MIRILALFSILALISCGNDIDIPNTPLSGQVNGKDWEYESANAYITANPFEYRIKFLSGKEPGAGNPCGVPVPSLDYVEMLIKPQEKSYNLPLISPEKVSFRFQNGSELLTTSGFLEIYIIDRDLMRGYLQAEADDDNVVEGVFEVRFCN